MPTFTLYQDEHGLVGSYWEVVLYQKVRMLQSYTKGFSEMGEALEFAQLMLSNPALDQVVVHCVIGRCPE